MTHIRFRILCLTTVLIFGFDIKSSEIKKDFQQLWWEVPIALQNNTNPKSMKLYLTKDLKMIWVRNNIADKLGRIKRSPIKSNENFVNYHFSMIQPYIKLISCANVDFKNIIKKQEKIILTIINKTFAHETFYTLEKTYKEIIENKNIEKEIREFTIEDVEVIKKGDNMCIFYNNDIINPYYKLKVAINVLKEKGFANEANNEFLEMNKKLDIKG